MENPTARVGSVLVALMMLAGAHLVAASPASADVLISTSPGNRVCRGDAIKVGVWYQSYSGGPRRYRINVYAPSGRRVFHREGRATTRWQYWRIRANRLGRYRVVFRGRSSEGPWRAVYRVRSRRC